MATAARTRQHLQSQHGSTGRERHNLPAIGMRKVQCLLRDIANLEGGQVYQLERDDCSRLKSLRVRHL
jgi:hypothetical protein